MRTPPNVARERMKRKLVAARLRTNYKYKDPSRIPVSASEADNEYERVRRPTPFADQRR